MDNNILIILLVLTLVFTVAGTRTTLQSETLSPKSLFIFTFSVFYLTDLIFALLNYSNQIYLSGYVFYLKEEVKVELFFYYVCILAVGIYTLKSDNFSFRKKEIWANTIRKIGKDNLIYLAIFMNALCLALLGSIILKAGFFAFFINLSLRATLFAESTFINALSSAAITFSGVIVASYSLTDRPKRALLILSIASILMLAIFMAARAVLVELLFTYLFIRHHSGRTFRLQVRHLIFIWIATVILVELAFQTRITADGDQEGIFNRIFLTEQIPQAENGLIYLSNIGTLNSTSILSSIFAWVPRDLLDSVGFSKGYGGNADFTAAFLPHRWFDQNSQISIGGVNEALVNFGFLIGLLTFGVWFYTLNYIYKKILMNSKWCLLSIPLTWTVFQLLRGDFFHTINKLAISIIIIAILIFTSRIKIYKMNFHKWQKL